MQTSETSVLRVLGSTASEDLDKEQEYISEGHPGRGGAYNHL